MPGGLGLAEPAPGVWVDGIAGQTVTLVLRGWVKSPDVWAVQTELLRAVKQRIDAGELSLPATAHEVSGALRKHPVDCGDRAGFIVNALLFPYLNNAVAHVRVVHVSCRNRPSDV